MTKQDWTFMTVGVVSTAAFAAFVILKVLPDGRAARAADRALEAERSVSVTTLPDGYRAYTVKHDDHLWAYVSASGSRTLVHHPDCPCGRAPR